MIPRVPPSPPTAAPLSAIIRTRTKIAKPGLELEAVMALVAREAQTVARVSGAVVELAQGDDMVYRAVGEISPPSRWGCG